MLTRNQYLLVKLAEECNEVAQRALKQVQFGADEVQEGQSLTNEERLRLELTDLMAVRQLLVESGELRKNDPVTAVERFLSKNAKVEKYLKYSQSLGQVAA